MGSFFKITFFHWWNCRQVLPITKTYKFFSDIFGEDEISTVIQWQGFKEPIKISFEDYCRRQWRARIKIRVILWLKNSSKGSFYTSKKCYLTNRWFQNHKFFLWRFQMSFLPNYQIIIREIITTRWEDGWPLAHSKYGIIFLQIQVLLSFP